MDSSIMAQQHRAAKYRIIQGTGPVAQVAHPTDIDWTSTNAVQSLLEAAAQLPSDINVVLTGGRFITLTYPFTAPRNVSQGPFLQCLTEWTRRQLAEVISTFSQSSIRRDFVIGVDVLIDGRGTGQFALFVGRACSALVAKRFPFGSEERYLAGFKAVIPVHGPRVVETIAGKALLLVCHDAQAYNHRNRGSVRKAFQITDRARAIEEFDAARRTPGLSLALNLVHRIGRVGNTKTFLRSYSQMRAKFPTVNVIGSFGYEHGARTLVPDLLCKMTSPSMNLPKIVFSSTVIQH